MTLIHNLLIVLLPLLYALCAVNYAIVFVQKNPFFMRWCTRCVGLTLVIHAAFILLRYVQHDRLPIASLAEILDLVAFAVAGTYLYVEKIQSTQSTGVFILSMVVFVQLLASALLPYMPPAASAILSLPLLALHVTAAILAYSAMLVGAVYGGMYLILYRSLKKQQFGLVFNRLPSLDVTAQFATWSNMVGFIFLTLSMILGIAMGIQYFPEFYVGPKLLATIGVWLIYGLGLLAYFVFGFRGARSARLSVVAFITAILATWATSALWPGFHSFGAS